MAIFNAARGRQLATLLVVSTFASPFVVLAINTAGRPLGIMAASARPRGTSFSFGAPSLLPGIPNAADYSQESLGTQCFGASGCDAFQWDVPYGFGGPLPEVLYAAVKLSLGGWQPQQAVATFPPGSAWVFGVSCASFGDCVAYGTEETSTSQSGAIVIVQHQGAWSAPRSLEASSALTGYSITGITLVCTFSGSCSGGGSASPQKGQPQAFVVDQRDGTWSKITLVPGVKHLPPTERTSGIGGVTCSAAGSCLEFGDYSLRDRYGTTFPFTDEERDYRWLPARALPGLQSLGAGHNVMVTDSACARPGFCIVVGRGATAPVKTRNKMQFFLEVERSWRWSKTVFPEGIIQFYPGGQSSLNPEVACPTVSLCVGLFPASYNSSSSPVFSVTIHDGLAARAVKIPGTGLGGAESIGLVGLSCPTATNCAAAFEEDQDWMGFATAVGGTWSAPSQPTGFSTFPSDLGPIMVTFECSATLACSESGNSFSGLFVANG